MICGHCDRTMDADSDRRAYTCPRCGSQCSARTLQIAMGYSPTYPRIARPRTHAPGLSRRGRGVRG